MIVLNREIIEYISLLFSQCLRDINNLMKIGDSRARNALSFEGEDGPSPKRLCLRNQSALERRLNNVVNDREQEGNQDQA